MNTDDNPLIEYRAASAFAHLNTVAMAVDNLQALVPLHRPVTEHLTAVPLDDRQRLDRVHEAVQLLWQGVVARAHGELNLARQRYQRAHLLNPLNYQVRSLLEEDLAAQGRKALLGGCMAEANALLQRALALNAYNPQARFDTALVYAMCGEDAAAVVHFRHLLGGQTALPYLHFNLGVSLYRLGQYIEAAEQFAQAVAREPTSAAASFNLANSLAKAGSYEEAVQMTPRCGCSERDASTMPSPSCNAI